MWPYSNTSQTFVFIKAPPRAATGGWAVPGHSREGQFCWSGSALGALMSPLHHLPEGACCSVLLLCHLLHLLQCCQSQLPRVSQGNHGNLGVPHSGLSTHTSTGFVPGGFGKGDGWGTKQHRGMSWHTTGMALQQLGKGGAFPQQQHNALHFHGISGGDKERFIPLPHPRMCGREPDQLIQ